jgi:excinuclease ABC subunit C
MQDTKLFIKNLPNKPGVYRFYDIGDNLLYVGKAKNLKKRIASYFQTNKSHNQRISLMISQIDRVDFTVVSSEKESLILEANLIQNLQPKYNIQLKDDKSYIYVRFTSDQVPAILLSRKKYDPRSTYFGPYTKTSGILNSLATLRTVFPYCQEQRTNGKPCNYVGIKQCDGICAGKESIEDYISKIEQIKNVLSGRTESVEKWLENKVETAINDNNFQLAALWRDRKKILLETIKDQKIVLKKSQNIDLMSIMIEEDSEGLEIASVFIQNIREGKIINVTNQLLSGSELEDNTEPDSILQVYLRRIFANYPSREDKLDILIQAFRVDKYGQTKKITINSTHTHEIETIESLKIYTKNIFGENYDQIKDLLIQGCENSLIYLQRNKLGQKLSLFEENNLFLSVIELQKALNLDHVPRRIECFDISHLSGKYVYGSMVTFIDGRSTKKLYKLFKTKEQNNDFENHSEVFRRRLQRFVDSLELTAKEKKAWELPDLVIIDGGKGQLSSVMNVLSEFSHIFDKKNMCFNMVICSLAKENEEIFLPNREGSIILSGQAKFLIQRIRDEAHRFAITNNRKARIKSIRKSVLDKIDGIGEKTRIKILQEFGSVSSLIETIDKNPDLVNEKLGKNIVDKLKEAFGVF